MERKTRIFVSAYACEPGHGSEIGVGWHWVLEMSKHYELWVLTRESNRQFIEPWIAEHEEYARIHFLYFDLPKWARFWKKGLRGVRTYYNLWQTFTNPIVKRTMKENGIKVFHHLTYGNVLWKVSEYGRKQFFVWGPVGGLETIPAEYSREYGWKWRLIEWVRRLTVGTSVFNHGFRQRCKAADLILCKTEITKERIPAEYRGKAVLMTDVAVEQHGGHGGPGDEGTGNGGREAENGKLKAGNAGREAGKGKLKAGNGGCSFLTVGRLDAWRGFDLAIESFAEAEKSFPDIRLTIVGEGSDRGRLERLIREKGLEDKVALTGKVSMTEYRRLLDEADVVVNASLKEGAVTVSFDCMAAGKPLICLDTTGYTRYFSDEYAVIIPISGRKETIAALSEGMVRLTDCELRTKMGKKAVEAGKRFTWEDRGNEFASIMEKNYHRKKLAPKVH